MSEYICSSPRMAACVCVRVCVCSCVLSYVNCVIGDRDPLCARYSDILVWDTELRASCCREDAVPGTHSLLWSQ